MENSLPTLAQVEERFSAVLSGDNARIREATKFLKAYTKKQESVGPLAYILAHHQQYYYRQMAATMLKRNLLTLFQNLEETAQNELKAILIDRFFKEESQVVRKNIGTLIGIAATLTLTENKWPELYQVLGQATDRSGALEQRMAGLILLQVILDCSGEALKPFYSQFLRSSANPCATRTSGSRLRP